jgi:prophage antirepressor-like protein
MKRQSQQVVNGKKLCSKCGLLLPLDAFNKQSDASSGHYSQCRICKNSKPNNDKPLNVEQVKTLETTTRELSIFKFEEKQVRTVTVNEEPYFVAKDVSEILGYSDTEKMTRRLDEDEKLTSQFGASGQVREMVIINESGLYSAIIGSNKLEAKKFKKWVTSEVLPSIRKNGGYLAPQVDFTNPDIMINLLNNWKADRDRLIKANKAIEVANKAIELQKPKVEFYDAVTGSDDTIDMAQASKVLNMGIGRNNLFELLRSRKILLDNNTPKQAYVDRGWFRLIESKFSKPDGTNCIYTKTVVFQKGLEAIRKIIIEAYQSQEYDDLFNT